MVKARLVRGLYVVFTELAEKEILGASGHCPLLIDLAWKE